MAAITLRLTKGSPLTNLEIDTNFTNLNTDVGTRLLASSYTAADVLSKLLTVDTDTAGINATTLKGLVPATANTASTLVQRDASGNFSAGTITASLTGNISGNAATVTNGLYSTGSYSNPTWLTSLAGSKVTAIPNASLTNSSITINGTSVSLGGSINILTASNTWTGQQTFRDNLFSITDDGDNTRVVTFQASNISSGTTRSMIIPDETGVIATRTYADTAASTYTDSYVPTYVQTAGRNSQGVKTVSTAAPTGGSAGDIWYRV